MTAMQAYHSSRLLLSLGALLGSLPIRAVAATTAVAQPPKPIPIAAKPAPVAVKPAPLAEIADADGDVDVIRAKTGETVDGEEDLDLFEGDQVKTAVGAHATISFVGQHLLKLGERTALVIRTAKTDPKTGSFFGQVSLLAGKLFASFAVLGSGSPGFKVDTRTAVAAVKGTTFSVEAEDETSTVSVLEGTVATAGMDAQGHEAEAVDVPEGQETSVGRGERRPRALRAFLQDERRAALRERLAEIRDRAREHRELHASGGMDKVRALRRLAREGRLDQADPDLKAFLDGHPVLRERITRHAERHRRMAERRERVRQRREGRAAKRH